MRLFIAFDISQEAKEELEKLQDDIKKSSENDAKLSLVKDFHLTLKFLGEVDGDKVEEIKDRLNHVKSGRFTAELDGMGVFPSEDHIRVAWMGIGPKEKITLLQQQIEESLKGMFPKDERFHPHLTLARVKFVKDKKAFIESIKRLKPEKISFEVNSFSLIKSTLTKEGPVYEVLGEFKQ